MRPLSILENSLGGPVYALALTGIYHDGNWHPCSGHQAKGWRFEGVPEEMDSAAGGDSPAGRPDSARPGRGPGGQSRSSSPALPPTAPSRALWTAVFARVSEFKGIKAQVSHGVVVLSGDTTTFAANQKAVDMAAKIAGVVYVVDQIAVEAQVGSYIAPAWRKLRQIGDQVPGLRAPDRPRRPGYPGLLPDRALGHLLGSAIPPPGRQGACCRAWCAKWCATPSCSWACWWALEILGLTALIGAFMGAAGILGLALGFAFKDIAENYVAGFLLGVRSPFAYRDWIAVGEHQG